MQQFVDHFKKFVNNIADALIGVLGEKDGQFPRAILYMLLIMFILTIHLVF